MCEARLKNCYFSEEEVKHQNCVVPTMPYSVPHTRLQGIDDIHEKTGIFYLYAVFHLCIKHNMFVYYCKL